MSLAVTEKRTYDIVSEAECQGAAVGVVAGGREVNVSQLSQNKTYTMSLLDCLPDCPPLSFPEAQISCIGQEMNDRILDFMKFLCYSPEGYIHWEYRPYIRGLIFRR
jgi:hypothetical protein